ncbi:MAG: hypothetical protein U0V02_09070 [Anaerolineales bacterium]
MSRKKAAKELLVALLPKIPALDILKSEGWYHIPLENAPKRWPPKSMASYQEKVFGEESYKICHFGEVNNIDIVSCKELFPNDKKNQSKAENLYYRVQLKELQTRNNPI